MDRLGTDNARAVIGRDSPHRSHKPAIVDAIRLFARRAVAQRTTGAGWSATLRKVATALVGHLTNLLPP